jgi:methylated-DNA-[protein]-cysteine S-methyltransferase
MAEVTVAEVTWTVRDTPIGPLLLVRSDAGLVHVAFHTGRDQAPRAVASVARRLGCAAVEDPAALSAAALQLDEYFAEQRLRFDLPLDWSLTAGFNRRVLRELAAGVPYGSVVGYQDLADRVGEPGAARAVGVAMASNPLPVVVPCHRVVESGGGIGGFGGGLETKRTLLALEGVLPAPLF